MDEDIGFKIASYTNSFYFVVTTMTTVGFGDQVPTKSIPMIFSFLLELLGIIVYGYSMKKANTLINLLQKSNSDNAAEKEDFDHWISLREKMSRQPTIKTVVGNIRQYMNFLWRNNVHAVFHADLFRKLTDEYRDKISHSRAENLSKEFSCFFKAFEFEAI